MAKIEVEFQHEVTDEESLEETCTDEITFEIRYERSEGGYHSYGGYIRDSDAPDACSFCKHAYTAEEKAVIEAMADQRAGEYDDTPDPD